MPERSADLQLRGVVKEFGAFTAVEPLRIHHPQRLARLGEVLGLGGLPETLEIDAPENEPRRLRGRGQLDRFTRHLGRVLVLAKVIEAPGFGQRIGRGHERSRQPDEHERGEQTHEDRS